MKLYLAMLFAFVAGLVIGEYVEGYKWRLRSKRPWVALYSQGWWYHVLSEEDFAKLNKGQKPSTLRSDNSGIPLSR